MNKFSEQEGLDTLPHRRHRMLTVLISRKNNRIILIHIQDANGVKNGHTTGKSCFIYKNDRMRDLQDSGNDICLVNTNTPSKTLMRWYNIFNKFAMQTNLR